ncbi:hypothetical protein G7Y79_00046g082080 [Physcia stellaris]|nr:hypothetical protein G7Y79_00046g082080 [Physcia stellaris]
MHLPLLILFLPDITLSLSIPLHPFSHPHPIPIPTTPTSQPLNTTSSWSCYNPLPRLHFPSLPDCDRVVLGIRHLNVPSRPLLFSRAEHADIVLPARFFYRTCAVIVDTDQDPESEAVITMEFFLQRIKALKYRCVVRPPFLGGEGPIGTGGKLRVGIMGPLEPGVGRNETGVEIS